MFFSCIKVKKADPISKKSIKTDLKLNLNFFTPNRTIKKIIRRKDLLLKSIFSGVFSFALPWAKILVLRLKLVSIFIIEIL